MVKVVFTLKGVLQPFTEHLDLETTEVDNVKVHLQAMTKRMSLPAVDKIVYIEKLEGAQ